MTIRKKEKDHTLPVGQAASMPPGGIVKLLFVGYPAEIVTGCTNTESGAVTPEGRALKIRNLGNNSRIGD